MRVSSFSDTYAFENFELALTYSCYLVRHGDDYMIWDAGNPLSDDSSAAKKSLVEQLAELKLKPEQIRYLGISHNHSDHIGQAGSFPKATLLIGKPDWEQVVSPTPPRGWTAEDCWGDRSWDPAWYVAAGEAEEAWTAEIAIPLAELAGEPTIAGKCWAVGVQRTVPGTGFQSWTTPAAARAVPEGFGLLLIR